MPKIKTHSGAKKRFKLSKNGKVIRAHANKSHILNKKTTKRKRGLRKTTVADKTNVAQVKSKHFKMAKQAVMKSGNYAYIGRKHRKRDFRRLWITRISAACRINGVNYSTFMNGLKKAGVTLNRKMLSEIAISDPAAFAKLVEQAKNA